jgi:hypothetical protein
MRKIKLLFAILLLLLLYGNCLSQDTNIVKYLPLKVGNVWVYKVVYHILNYGDIISYEKYKIVNTFLYMGHLYYINEGVSNNPAGCSGNNIDTTRIDSTNGNIYRLKVCSGYSVPIKDDSLKASIGDTVKGLCSILSSIVCVDTSNVVKFGNINKSKGFYIFNFELGSKRRYIKNIGIDTSYNLYGNASCSKYLLGCVINGTLYGDTSFITGINPISTEILKDFMLYQNFPNPFNPTTKIKFDIPLSPLYERGVGGFISLKVFDILGHEVSTLVNEQLKPGTYEVEFDGSNYASGVYYYQLTAGEFKETKKMVIIK